MNNITPFNFSGWNIRVVEIDGEPWFVGKDVADALGYGDPSTAIRSHCKGVQKLHPLQTTGGKQEVRVLAEPDLLRLIVSSTLPSAEKFERWVFEEVLPTIRKTGAYRAPAPELTRLEILQQALESEMRALALEAKVEKDAPKVAFAEAVGAAEDDQKVAEVAKAIGVGPRVLIGFMKQEGILMRSGLPYQQHIDRNRLRVVEVAYVDTFGKNRIRAETRVTGKGVTFLQQRLAREAANDAQIQKGKTPTAPTVGVSGEKRQPLKEGIFREQF